MFAPSSGPFSHAASDWIQLLTDTGALGVVLAILIVDMSALALRSVGATEGVAPSPSGDRVNVTT
jgi:hypothetical protein